MGFQVTAKRDIPYSTLFLVESEMFLQAHSVIKISQVSLIPLEYEEALANGDETLVYYRSC